MWGRGYPTDPDGDHDGTPDILEDWDGDGLSNYDEKQLGTNLFWADSDVDGLSDGVERALGSDPRRPDTDADGIRDGDEDVDGDGLSIAQELALGANPFVADTDGDGVGDGDEVALCTDPTQYDDPAADAFCVTRGPDGVTDWKIFQRGADDTAAIPVPFRYRLAEPARLEVALLDAHGVSLPGLDFADHARAIAPGDGTGDMTLVAPTGGNYTLVARLVTAATTFERSVQELAVGDVFLAAGQSNMAGLGFYHDVLPEDGPDERVHLFGNDYRWQIGREPMDDARGAVDPVSNGDIEARVSPMLRFARDVAGTTGVPVGIVPAPASGSFLVPAPGANPYTTGWTRRADDPEDRRTLYGSALHRVRLQHFASPIRGVIWYQGESEADLGVSVETYRAALATLVADLRADLGNPTLFFASAQLSASEDPAPATQAHWMAIREAQRLYAASDPHAALIGTLDLPHVLVHLTAAAYRTVGTRLARAVLAGVYGRPIGGPRLVSLRRRNAGRRVYLTYDAWLVGGNPGSFRVEADGVEVPVTAVRVLGRRVRLTLATPVPSGATVGYGFGTPTDPGWLQARDGSGAPLAFAALPVAP